MRFFKFTPITLATVLLVTAGTAIAKQEELPQITEDGLHRLADSKMAIVYAEPGADLAQYERIQLMDAYVAFKKNWARDQRSKSADKLSVTSRDVEKIKTNLAKEFQQVFRQTLEDGGYEIVDEAGEDVLLVRPAIINLDVNAPDTMRAGRSRSYTNTSGEMTLYIEIYDSVTGDMIAKALDRKADTARQGYYTWTNSVTNKAAATRILQGWAEILLDALNEAKQQ